MCRTGFVFAALMLAFIPFLIFGAVTAEYTPEEQVVLQVRPGPYTSDTTLGAKLGTLIVTTTEGDKIHTPTWGTVDEVWGGVPLKGAMRAIANGPFWDDATDTFYIMSVAYPEGYPGPPTIQRLEGTYTPIIKLSSSTVSVNPFRVELWLINTALENRNATVIFRPASYFRLNTVYTLPEDFSPMFSFISAKNPSTHTFTLMKADGTPESAFGSYVAVNGTTGSNSIDIASGLDPGGMPYIDPQQTVSFSVFLSEQSTTFDLFEAVGTNRKDVNTMTFVVSNGESGIDYSQEVIFTDTSTGSDDFMLHDQEPGPALIPFSLYFGSEEVTKGEPVTWNTLQNGDNTRTIRIGGIDEIAIQGLASGTYSDRITVEIRNP